MFRKNSIWAPLLIAALLLAGCGTAGGGARSAPALTPARDLAETPDSGIPLGLFSGNSGSYTAPEFAVSAFHADQAEGDGTVQLDLSALAEGYVAISARSDHRLKFQVITPLGTTYNYDVSSQGTPSIFPLQDGNGEYRFRVMENVVDSKYAEIYAASRNVTLLDPFQPFLRPSDYVTYSPDSACVKKASDLAGRADTALEVVAEVYKFICSAVKYDTKKAAEVRSGYLPDPDETMRTGKGICFDYASLAAAMLRSQGIPAKEIFGYVSPDGLYHAWNMFYTEESGWVTVSYQVTGPDWNRMDLTFSANGADAMFIGNGENYSDLYSY